MFLNRLKAGAVVLMAACTMASLTTLAASKGRIFTPDGKLVYVNVYSTAEGVDQNFLYNFVTVNILPEIKRVRGVGTATILGNRAYAMRIRLNPDRMRAYNLSSEDIKNAFRGCSMIGSPEQLATKTSQSGENVLTHIGRYNKPEQYENIILKANPDGEILRLKDVGRGGVGLPARRYRLGRRRPSRRLLIVLKPAPGSNAAEVIEAIKEKLERDQDGVVPSRHGVSRSFRSMAGA